MQMELEQRVLTAWHAAHGKDAGQVSSSWGEDRVVVMIEDMLFKGEQLLVQSEYGNVMFEQYVQALLNYVIETQTAVLSDLLPHAITSTSMSVNTREGWVMFIFKLQR